MKFYSFPIATSAILLFSGLITVGCSQTTVSNTAEKPSEKPPGTGIASVNSSAKPTPSIEANDRENAASTPPTIVEVEPIQAKPLTAKTEPDRTKESSKSQKPIANRALLFSCMTNEGKEILLFETDDTIDYSFGDPGSKPELDLQVPRDQASTWQWKGVGRAMSYAVDVPNGDTSYSVFWSVDRLSATKAVEAGVRVHRDRKTLATVYCTDKIVSNLRGVKLKSTEY